MAKLPFLALLSIIAVNSVANEIIPDRRKDQYPTLPAYLVVPLPYSLPGIGDGMMLLGNISNVAETTADVYGIEVFGDAKGTLLFADEIPLYQKWISLDLNYMDIDRAAVKSYRSRGMQHSDANDFRILDVNLAQENSAALRVYQFDKRLDLFLAYAKNEYHLEALRDNNGDLITKLDEPYISKVKQINYGANIDLTDDNLDPRSGVRLGLSYIDHPRENDSDPDFYTLDYNLLTYIPIGKIDSLVINYYQSDAHMRSPGNTDPDAIRDELGTNCAPTDTGCLQSEQALVDSIINQRVNGTATSLGGDQRLRAYPGDRFSGAHMAFFGAELRWNFSQEVTPFDYFIWKDVRTGMQLAFFYEIATVAEASSDLWNETRYSAGIGGRLIAGSGGVYRADFAYGSEGSEISVIFEYPWE